MDIGIKSRWYQFMKRQLRPRTLVLFVATCVVITWFAVRVQRARSERSARERAAVIGLFEVFGRPAGLSRFGWVRSFHARHSPTETPSDVVDAALAHLELLSGLQSLDLCGLAVTDAGLEHLSGLDKLQVTDSGVTKLKQALPGCRVIRR